MNERAVKTILVPPDHKIIVYQGDDQKEGSYISLQHNEKISDMPGEVLLAAADTPALIKALTEAALTSTMLDCSKD